MASFLNQKTIANKTSAPASSTAKTAFLTTKGYSRMVNDTLFVNGTRYLLCFITPIVVLERWKGRIGMNG
jgi:hypothetical protein